MLTFVATAGSFSVTGAFTAAHALSALGSSGAGFEVVQSHTKILEFGFRISNASQSLALTNLLAARAEDFIAGAKGQQRGKRGLHDVGVIAGTE